MPNWVKNYVTIETKNGKQLDDVIEFVHSDERSVDFEKIIPMPNSIFRGDLGNKERETYGSDNWYDWSIDNWGTKWNACYSDVSGNTLDFETAWSAPHPVIAKLAELFPDVRFVHEFADEDIGNNCGVFTYENGKLVDEDYRYGDIEFACELWGDDPEDFQ